MKFLTFVLTFCVSAICAAAELPGYLHIQPNGTLVLDGRWSMGVRRFDPVWRSVAQRSTQVEVGYPKNSGGLFETRGIFDAFRLTQKTEAMDAKRFRWNLGLAAVSDPVDCNLLYVAVDLPLDRGVELTIGGKKIEMTTATQKKNVFDARVKELTFTDADGSVTISGDFRAVAAGAFKNNDGDYFQLRLMPVGIKFPGRITEWELTFDVKAEFTTNKVKSLPVDFTKVFNRALTDEVAEDGKGGWTDQGPEMDLRAFKPGNHNFYGLAMKTADSCLVFGRGAGKTAKIPLKNVPAGMTNLYLLHASAWTSHLPVGTLKATFADGSSQLIPVAGSRDCGNWYKPVGGTNARVVWEADVPAAGAGLYLSHFALKDAPVQLEFFESDAGSMWMVLGASLADGKLRLPRNNAKEFIVQNGPQWLPIAFSGDTAPGTPLDFSVYRDAPAGKYGAMTADKNGYFSFEKAPGKRIRLFGPNLVGSANYLPRETVDDFIGKAERLGYNTIRLHHFEYGLLDPKATDTLTFNPEALDQLQYLFAKLKERGFYICIDLYASRKLKEGDNIPEWDNTGDYSMKNLVCVSPAALANWKEFARRLLTAKNPYTGMTMAEDPALYSLNLVNENPLIQSWNAIRSGRKAAEIIRTQFEEHLKNNKFDGDEFAAKRNGLFIEFLNGLQAKCMDEQMRFLRDDIKLKAMITDFNHLNQYTLAGLRSKLDFVDNHQYWDHPSFPAKRWDYPFVFRNQSSISLEAANPRQLMGTRVFGKPFTVTEFNFCVPNTWRVECPSVLGAYAALQDWDGLYRFAWSHGRDGMKKEAKNRLSQFDIVNNLQAQMAERIIHMLFVRGDVKAAKEAVAFEFDPAMIRDVRGNSNSGHYPDEFSRLGLWGRIGSLNQETDFPGVLKVDPLKPGWRKALPASAEKAMKEYADTGTLTSATGELVITPKTNTLRIVTPKSEVFTSAGKVAGKVLTAEKLSCYQTLALHSLDDKALAESGRILLIQLTDLSNDGLRFDNDKRQVLRDWGKVPLMLERGSAVLSLSLPRKMKVVALELDGTPGKEIPAEYQNGKLTFRAATDLLPGGTLSYLISTE